MLLYRFLSFIQVWLFSLQLSAQPITLVSWNLKDLGSSKSAEEVRFIAKTLRHADVVAIQEVVAGYGGAQAVGRLAMELNTLGAAWDYVVSNPTSSSAYKTERYAFVWKKSRVTLQGKPWLEQKYGLLIDREPFLATFSCEGKRFTVVNFHAITASKQPETEIKYLRFLPEEYPGLRMIFAGDFNLPQSHAVFGPLKDMGYHAALQHQKTSLRQTCTNGDCLASEFDNIFYPAGTVTIADKGIIPFYENVESFEKARLVSDHVPVFVQFSLR